jgi:hypothetical protein
VTQKKRRQRISAAAGTGSQTGSGYTGLVAVVIPTPVIPIMMIEVEQIE